MSQHPLNLLVRFLMEIAALVIFGMWGWHAGAGIVRYVAAIGLPAVAAAIWGIFRIPNDPKPAPVEVPGIVRLAYELLFFGFAAWALYDMGYITSSYTAACLIILHYAASYDRTWKMLTSTRKSKRN